MKRMSEVITQVVTANSFSQEILVPLFAASLLILILLSGALMMLWCDRRLHTVLQTLGIGLLAARQFMLLLPLMHVNRFNTLQFGYLLSAVGATLFTVGYWIMAAREMGKRFHGEPKEGWTAR